MVETITYMYQCKYLITYTRYTNDAFRPSNQKALDDINTALIRPKNLPEKIYEQYIIAYILHRHQLYPSA